MQKLHMEKAIWQIVWLTGDAMPAYRVGSFVLISYFVSGFMRSHNILICKFLLK